MDHELNEMLQSMFQSASDIQRLIMLTAVKGSASKDRRNDIVRAANRIAELAERIPE